MQAITKSGHTCHWQEDSGEFIKISDFKVEQGPSLAPGYIVKLGEPFSYLLELEFTKFLGTISGGAEILIGFSALDLTTGSVQPAYSKSMLARDLAAPRISNTEKKWDGSDPSFSFNATVLGNFQMVAWVIVPSTGLAAFVSGPMLMVFP